METRPELIPLDRPLQTMRNVWTVKLVKTLGTKAEHKGVGFTWEFTTLTESRRLTYWVAKEDWQAGSIDEQVRQGIRDWLDYSNEGEGVIDPCGLSRR